MKSVVVHQSGLPQTTEKKLAVIAEVKHLAKENNGLVNPERWVEYASDPSTASHECFTWDDQECGKRLRIIQARSLLRVMVEYLPSKNGSYQSTRIFVSLPRDRSYNEEDGSGGYRMMVDVLNNNQMKKELIDSALLEMNTFQKKYRTISELDKVFSAMEEAKPKLKK